MLRDGQDADTAVVGLIFSILVIFQLALWSLEPSSEKAYAYTREQCAIQKLNHANGNVAAFKVDQPKVTASGTDDEKDTKNDHRDWCDLAAQESMAKSTLGMEWSAWATTFVSFCGLLLLGMTVHYTKRAAEAAASTLLEAEKTTAAAAEMNSITRKGYQDEHRAWIRVDGIKVAVEGAGDKTDGFRVDLRLKTSIRNAGRTPATDVNVNITFAEMPKTIDEAIYSAAVSGGVQTAFKVALMPNDVCHKPQTYFIDNDILASKFLIIVLITYTAYPGTPP